MKNINRDDFIETIIEKKNKEITNDNIKNKIIKLEIKKINYIDKLKKYMMIHLMKL